ncbi:hypothetical protein D0817_05480 [Flavobacterium cupreum]|uniref:Response regulator n=1 Tax=Flavobacterium cupreum TaxID=2133766 RepID=A0A434AAD6_9FLAO|nr:hypothetical protein [Flavobacterium cupreum]RUT71328.1 hypothetical protein D0817_05480 [Flavobacterium cupreum]
MNINGPIVLIENNQGDRKLFMEIFSELEFSNEVLYFNSASNAYHYLTSRKIEAFLIFSDIVLLNTDDEKLIHITYENLSIELNCPCLFFTTSFTQCFVIDLYSVPPQSYVIKPYDYEKFKYSIKNILEYWSKIKSIEDYKSDPLRRKNIKNNLN